MRVSEIRVKRIRVNQGLGVYHFWITSCFEIVSFLKLSNFFCRLEIKQTQVQPKKYLAGSTFGAKIYIWLAVQLCASKERSY